VRRRFTLGLATAAVALLAGCSPVPDGAIEARAYVCPVGEEGCPENIPIGDGGQMEVHAGEFYFDVVDGIAVTGEVEITFVNDGPTAFHDLVVIGRAEGSEIAEADPGETDTATVLLFPGEWTIFCSVPGHRGAGMEDVIQVFATAEEAAEAEAEGIDPADPAAPGTDE
jgi:plastocyanin